MSPNTSQHTVRMSKYPTCRMKSLSAVKYRPAMISYVLSSILNKGHGLPFGRQQFCIHEMARCSDRYLMSHPSSHRLMMDIFTSSSCVRVSFRSSLYLVWIIQDRTLLHAAAFDKAIWNACACELILRMDFKVLLKMPMRIFEMMICLLFPDLLQIPDAKGIYSN